MGFEENIYNIVYSIVKAHLLICAIIIVSFIIERFTPLVLFIKQFKGKKSSNNARAFLESTTYIYILFLLSILVYDIVKGKIQIESTSLIIWALVMFWLVHLFRKFIRKYQKVDPDKSDHDFSLD